MKIAYEMSFAHNNRLAVCSPHSKCCGSGVFMNLTIVHLFCSANSAESILFLKNKRIRTIDESVVS